ncbi:hypothetical protein TrLO_g5668 [Triparma laevis f. longispina]|uniref:Uncharacterized protein n=1 Tax=Triparma laevis f. longispina TaxID=1714387 RepID=A0A9W7C5U4_9STRA|nr:hypothetical protein TrLO_g5668 [Triparma laevis f. longispina]
MSAAELKRMLKKKRKASKQSSQKSAPTGGGLSPKAPTTTPHSPARRTSLSSTISTGDVSLSPAIIDKKRPSSTHSTPTKSPSSKSHNKKHKYRPGGSPSNPPLSLFAMKSSPSKQKTSQHSHSSQHDPSSPWSPFPPNGLTDLTLKSSLVLHLPSPLPKPLHPPPPTYYIHGGGNLPSPIVNEELNRTSLINLCTELKQASKNLLDSFNPVTEWIKTFKTLYMKFITKQIPTFHILNTGCTLTFHLTPSSTLKCLISDDSLLPFKSGTNYLIQKSSYVVSKPGSSQTSEDVAAEEDINELENMEETGIQITRSVKRLTPTIRILSGLKDLSLIYDFLINCFYINNKFRSKTEIPVIICFESSKGMDERDVRVVSRDSRNIEFRGPLNFSGIKECLKEINSEFEADIGGFKGEERVGSRNWNDEFFNGHEDGGEMRVGEGVKGLRSKNGKWEFRTA